MRGTQFAELSAFVTVAEEKSFTKAAKELGISTATLSQSIKSLEGRLGVRLLNRTTRNVAVSDVGERLLSRLRPVLNDYEAAIESINDFRDRPCGMLRLTVPPPVAEFLLAPLLARFLKQYPDIKIEISADAALTNIVEERFDAGIRAGRRVERDMVAVKIREPWRAQVAAAPSYLVKHGTPLHPQDLRSHNCIGFRFPRGLLPWSFEKKGKRLDVAVHGSVITNDPALAVRMATDGVGLIYFADEYMAAALAQRKLVTILDDWMPAGDELYLYYPSRRQNPAALQALIDFLKAAMKERK